MIKLNYLLCIILIWLQYSLWFGKNGVHDFISIYNVIKLYEKDNDFLNMKARNNQLLLEIYDLIYGYDSIEERSRYELGMIRSDESFYRIKQDN